MSEWSESYRESHSQRYTETLDQVEDIHQGGKILEIGCVPGHLTRMLRDEGYDVYGVDIDPTRAEVGNVQIEKCNIETDRLPFSDSEFSTVLFNEIFEHLRVDMIHVFEEIARVCEDGGVLLLTTPNMYAITKIQSYIQGKGLGIDIYKEYEKIKNVGHMGHVREYSLYEMDSFIRKFGFEVNEVDYCNFNHLSNPQSLKAWVGKKISVLIPQFRRYLIITAEFCE